METKNVELKKGRIQQAFGLVVLIMVILGVLLAVFNPGYFFYFIMMGGFIPLILGVALVMVIMAVIVSGGKIINSFSSKSLLTKIMFIVAIIAGILSFTFGILIPFASR